MATKQQLYELRDALNDIIASTPDDVVAEVAAPIQETPEEEMIAEPEVIAEEVPAVEPTEDTPALDDAGG